MTVDENWGGKKEQFDICARRYGGSRSQRGRPRLFFFSLCCCPFHALNPEGIFPGEYQATSNTRKVSSKYSVIFSQRFSKKGSMFPQNSRFAALLWGHADINLRRWQNVRMINYNKKKSESNFWIVAFRIHTKKWSRTNAKKNAPQKKTFLIWLVESAMHLLSFCRQIHRRFKLFYSWRLGTAMDGVRCGRATFHAFFF